MTTGDERMKIAIAGLLAWMALPCAASAQAPTPGSTQAPSKGYAEVVAQSAFGNVTSQSFGGELGITVVPGVQVFVEAGRVNNVATAEISAAAAKIAGYLSQTQANASYAVKEPATFGVAGLNSTSPSRQTAAVRHGGRRSGEGEAGRQVLSRWHRCDQQPDAI